MRSIEALRGFRDSMVTTLKSIGIQSRSMDPGALLALLDELMLVSTDNGPREFQYNEYDPINVQLTDPEKSLRVLPGRLMAGGEDEDFELRCFTVRTYPEIWAQWQGAGLIGHPTNDFQRMPGPFLTVFSFTATDSVGSANKAGMKATRATQQAGTGIARYVPDILKKERDWKFVAEKLKQGQKLVKCSYTVVAYARKGEGRIAEQALRSIYKANNWHLSREYFVQLQSFLSCLPFMLSEGLSEDMDRLGRTRTKVTWTCANLAPLQGEWRGMDSPSMLLFGRRGEPFFWDQFRNPEGNYNVAVIGKSGSGKSVALQEAVAAIRGRGGRVFVVDDGRSFMNSCKMQGGHFVEFTAAGNICINPFSMIDAKSAETDADYRQDVLRLVNTIIRQMCRPTSKTSDVENAFIEGAVAKVWEERGTEGSVTDVKLILQSIEDPYHRPQDLALMLGPYAKGGIFERFFDGPCTLKIDSDLMVFELAELKSIAELQGIVLLMIMFLVTEAMYFGDRVRPIALVVDEAWDMLHGEASGKFIEGVARRARKYRGSLMTGTQGVDDYYKNPAALAAFLNSDWVCYLAQKPESIEKAVQEKKVVGEYMARELRSLRMVDRVYSEMMIVGPGFYHIGRLILDPWSVALYSSKGEDYVRIVELQEAGCTIEEAIDVVAGEIGGHRATIAKARFEPIGDPPIEDVKEPGEHKEGGDAQAA